MNRADAGGMNGSVSSARSRVRFDLSASGTLYQPPLQDISADTSTTHSPSSDMRSGENIEQSIQSIQTARSGSFSGTPLSSSPTRMVDERGASLCFSALHDLTW